MTPPLASGRWHLPALPWRWILTVAAGLVAVAPVALSVVSDDLPPVIFALPPMVIYVSIWTVFRQLDAPRAPRPPPPRRRAPPRIVVPPPRGPGSPRPAPRTRGVVTRRRPAPALIEQ